MSEARPVAKQPNLTKNQRLVLHVLNQAGAPLSAYAILDSLHDEGVRAPVQVYRALARLQDCGLVHRLESLNAFVACNHDHTTEVATVLAFCTDCHEVREFNNTVISGQLDRWAAQQEFEVEGAVVEVRGHCRTCAGKKSASAS